MTRRIISFLSWVTIGCLCSVLMNCTQPIAPPLRVGSNTWPGFEPLYLAQELGFFGDQPIQIINYPSSTEVSRAYRNGELEVVALTLDETLLLKQTEPDVKAFLVTDVSNGADVVLAKPEIPNLQGLKGKRVGVETTALGAYMLTRASEKGGLSVDDIEIVPLGFSEHEQAYQQGDVDAVVTFEPVRSTLIKEGATVIFDSSQIPNEIVDVLVARQELLDTQLKVLKALSQGWFRALEYIQQQPDDAIQRMANRQQISSKEFAESLKLLHIPDLPENQELLGQANSSLSQSLEQLSRIMLQQDLLQQKVDLENIPTDSVVKAS